MESKEKAEKYPLNSKRKLWILFYSFFLTGILVLLVGIVFIKLEIQKNRELKKQEALSNLSLIRAKIESSLNEALLSVYGITAFIASSDTIKNEAFYSFASNIVKSSSMIRSVQLAPNNVIRHVYPEKENIKVLGLRLLEDLPIEQMFALRKVIDKKQMVVAGPVNLIQGGRGIISRTPVYLNTSGKSEKYWGVVTVIVDLDSLIKQAGLNNNQQLQVAIRGKDGLGEMGELIFGDLKIYNENPVKLNINIPKGVWNIAAIPTGGWKRSEMIPYFILLLTIIWILASFIIWKLILWPLKLRNEINQRKIIEENLYKSEKRYRLLFEGASETILIINEHQIVECNEIALKLFNCKNKSEIIGFSPWEFSPEFQPDGLSSQVRAKEIIKKAAEGVPQYFYWKHKQKSGELIDTEVSLNIFETNEGKSIQAIINDITERMKSEIALQESEKKLRKLNNTKDKLFSIIAHDLKNPFNTILGFTDLLKGNIESYSKENIKKLADVLYEVSSNAYKLLENLLEWSMAQTGKIQFRPIEFNLDDLVLQAIRFYEKEAQMKQITIKYFPTKINFYADLDMIHIILRNLITNAIKFTQPNGSIFIDALLSKDGLQISVTDTGVGIDSVVLEKLFQEEFAYTSKGTNNEKGTGLGLLLCKEFIDIHKGKIWVNSTLGTGSCFTFFIPVQKTNSTGL